MQPIVVVGYDRRPHSAPALDRAADEAARRGALLLVVHAFPRIASAAHPPTDPAIQRVARAAAARIAERGVERARSRHPGLAARARAAAGSAPAVLAERACGAELVVVGCRAHDGSGGLVPGPVTARIATRPASPTMVVRTGGHEPVGTVVAAIDIADPVEEVLAVAFDEARLRRAGLRAISVRDASWPRVALAELLKPWQAKFPFVEARYELADGSPDAVLTAASSHADLIVAGAQRRHGGEGTDGDGHLSSTLYTLLTRAECPVTVVPRS